MGVATVLTHLLLGSPGRFALFLTLLAAVAAVPATRAAQHTQARGAREAQEREEPAQQSSKVYETYPTLKGREKCVARVRKARSPRTWQDLGAAALSVCLPSDQWVLIVTDEGGHSTFVDPTRFEFRKDNQVTFWELEEVFDQKHDFFLERVVADCDKKLSALISSAYVVGGHYSDPVDQTVLKWENILPDSLGEATLNDVCGFRAALDARGALSPPPPPLLGPPPPARPLPDTPPKVTPSI